jgi:acetyl esterase/lipase
MMRRHFLGSALAAVPVLSQSILDLPAPKADARIPYGSGPSQFGELRVPHGPGPHRLVIFLHGGFWRNAYNLNHAGHLCAALTKAGVATWNVEYRRVGDPGGGWPGTLEDVEHGCEHVRKVAKLYSLDLDHAIAVGHSAGGQLALWLASQMAVDLRGVVGLAAVSDLRRAAALRLGDSAVQAFLGGPPERYPSRYSAASPIELLPIPPQQRLVHGTEDDRVPFEFSERFVKASHNSKLVPIKGANHFDLIDPRSAAWKIVEKSILEWS